MPKDYQMRQGADGLWEVVDTTTGKVAKLSGVLLSGLEYDAAMGALDVLLNEIISPNNEGPAGDDSA